MDVLLKEFNNDGGTIFFSSHNLPEVEKVCNRVAIIRSGKLVAQETLDSLKKQRYRRIKFTLSESIENIQLNDAQLVRKQGLDYEFLVKGNINEIIKCLAGLPIADLIFPEPELEEVFLTFYQEAERE